MKKFLMKILAFTIAFSAFSAFVPVQNPNSVTNATESDKLTAAVYAMTGTLYYYDTPSGNIVLNDVKPFSVTAETSDAKENEYDTAAANAAAAMIYTPRFRPPRAECSLRTAVTPHPTGLIIMSTDKYGLSRRLPQTEA